MGFLWGQVVHKHNWGELSHNHDERGMNHQVWLRNPPEILMAQVVHEELDEDPRPSGEPDRSTEPAEPASGKRRDQEKCWVHRAFSQEKKEETHKNGRENGGFFMGFDRVWWWVFHGIYWGFTSGKPT